jgi:hypothetical protein
MLAVAVAAQRLRLTGEARFSADTVSWTRQASGQAPSFLFHPCFGAACECGREGEKKRERSRHVLLNMLTRASNSHLLLYREAATSSSSFLSSSPQCQ